jgi:hypothetical protein
MSAVASGNCRICRIGADTVSAGRQEQCVALAPPPGRPGDNGWLARQADGGGTATRYVQSAAHGRGERRANERTRDGLSGRRARMALQRSRLRSRVATSARRFFMLLPPPFERRRRTEKEQTQRHKKSAVCVRARKTVHASRRHLTLNGRRLSSSYLNTSLFAWPFRSPQTPPPPATQHC